MDPLFDRRQYPLSYFGESASLNLVRQLQTRPIIICPEADHSWLLPLLCLDQYPLTRRTYCGPSLPYTPENLERYLSEHEGELRAVSGLRPRPREELPDRLRTSRINKCQAIRRALARAHRTSSASMGQ